MVMKKIILGVTAAVAASAVYAGSMETVYTSSSYSAYLVKDSFTKSITKAADKTSKAINSPAGTDTTEGIEMGAVVGSEAAG